MINLKKEGTDERIIGSYKNIYNNDSGLKFVIFFSFLFIVVVFIIVGLSTNNHKYKGLKDKSYEIKIESLESKILSMKLDNLNRINELQQKRLDDLNKVSSIPRFQEKQVESIDSQEMISLRQKLREAEIFEKPFQRQKVKKTVELSDDTNEDNIIDNIVKLKKELQEQKSKLVSISKE